MVKEIETVIKDLLNNKSPGPDVYALLTTFSAFLIVIC